jgi:hypothetical protein
MFPKATTVNPGPKYMKSHLPPTPLLHVYSQKGVYDQEEDKAKKKEGSIYKHRKGIMKNS